MAHFNIAEEILRVAGSDARSPGLASQSVFDKAVSGDSIYFPRRTYFIDVPLFIKNKPLQIFGDGPSSSEIVLTKSATKVLEILGNSSTLSLCDLSLNGGVKAGDSVLKLRGIFTHLSTLRNIAIRGAKNLGVHIEGNLISTELDNVFVSGGKIGIQCEDTGSINAVSFRGLRISNTQQCALKLSRAC